MQKTECNAGKKISVIVPVYKAEAYLRRCIDSILQSTYQNLEVLLIDDGSPDNCPAICEEYAQKDERIRVFHKENGGVSSARNLGISLATGEYIAFCDSDDMVPANAYQILMQYVQEKDVDVVRGSVERTYVDSGEKRIWKRKESDSFSTLLIGFYGAIYKRSMLVEYQIVFEPFLIGEDQCFLAQVLSRAKELIYISDVVYCYLVRESCAVELSAMQKIQKEYRYYLSDFSWRLWVVNYVLNSEKLAKQYQNELSYFCPKVDNNWFLYTKEERDECFFRLKELVEMIDWKKQTQFVYDYIGVSSQKLLRMNEKQYTNTLKKRQEQKRRLQRFFGKGLGGKIFNGIYLGERKKG